MLPQDQPESTLPFAAMIQDQNYLFRLITTLQHTFKPEVSPM